MSSDLPLRRGLALTAVSALLATGASACGNDTGRDDPTAAAPTSAPTSSTPAGTTSPSATASETETASADPVPSPVIDKAARAAIKDGFPALVPSGVPAGWTVVKASYGATGWRIQLTDGAGNEAGVVQTRGELAPLVRRVLGEAAATSGTVDLGENGTGKWTAYSGGSHEGLAKVVAHTAAVVYAADQDTAVALADLLLTAEDGNMEGG